MKIHKRLAALITLYSIWPGLVLGGTLAEIPLNLRSSVPSNVLFDISVEWPTAITAAYNGQAYVKANQYEGLFDPNLCYDYPADHFVPVATASNHGCGAGQWSGNFLNWSTMTGLDAFRYATTGGNRSTDTATLTILERTYISNQGNLFPDKTFNPTTIQFVGAAPFTFNTTYTMVNKGKGIQMTLTGTETTTTTAPQSFNATTTCNASWSGTSPYCSQFKATVDGTTRTGTCTTWTGNGTSGNPYKCTAFGNFSTINVAPTFNSTTCGNVGTAGGKYVCRNYDTKFTYNVTSTTTNNVNNTYNVRVEACNSGLPLRENCQQYGSVYKPVGEIQRNGEKMRFGVFAYYNSTDIDNAVMRSKLKYVGPRKYSGSLGFVNNSNKEWNLNDGTFYSNPDETEATSSWGGAVNNSGVINYLNKFGRQSGSYKTYDNFGKMYYESLRYLRKLPPTQAFYQYSSTANNDDFPVITDWYRDNDDPIQYTCQKNYIIAMGDQFTHCDKHVPGGSFASYGPGQCAATARQQADQGSLADAPDPGPSGTDAVARRAGMNATRDIGIIGGLESIANMATTGTGAGTAASFYMAGMAHWAAITDIRTDLANNVPYRDSNGAPGLKGQSVKTFIINVEENASLGVNSQFWYAAKYGGAENYDPSTYAPLDWSKNVTHNSYKSDGSVNQTFTGAWPKSLLRAGDPASMIASIKEALATIDGEIGTNSALSQSSGDLRTGDGAYIYRAIFDSNHWSGDVQAYKINTNGTIDSTPVWQAASLLPTPGNRVIMSFNDGLLANGDDDTGTNTRRGISFNPTNFTSALSGRQQAFLNKDEFGTLDNEGANRMRYLRGESGNEKPNGLQWRPRTWTTNGVTTTNRLGDIVNSNPLYVGAPAPNMPGEGYNDFAAAKKNRKPAIYVGANDGMLHAFDASKPGTTGATPGQELFAYIPSAVFSRLSQLTSPGYSHKYYVDGSPTVSEACLGTCGSSSDWRTVLVGGLNAGGQGVYALNVTDPAQFSTANPTDIVMWEFTDRDDPDLGYTFSKPVIRLMNNGKWAVIFGNGFNSTVTDGKVGNGRAYLYILLIDGPGAGNKWVKDTNYFKIELKSPDESTPLLFPTTPLSDPHTNGLASVAAVDSDLNGTADSIYAGDLQGNIWKIDVTDTSPNNWVPAFGSASSPEPLFAAKYTDATNTDLKPPITTGIEVSPHPFGGYMVLFGTGSYINSSDNLGPFKVDSMFGIWDKEDEAGTRVTSRDKLQKQKVIETLTDAGTEYLFLSGCKPNYTDADVESNEQAGLCPADIAGTEPDLGWVFDLPDSGERTTSELPMLRGGILTFTTLTPSDDPCTGNTVGRLYYLDYLSGGVSSPGVMDINGDGKIDAADKFDLTVIPDGPDGPVKQPPSGVKLDGGATDNPTGFYLPRLQTENATDRACPDFIPGWGCPSELAPQRNCRRWVQDVISEEALRETLTAGGTGLDTRKVCLPGKAGRLTWRQLAK